MSSVQYMIHLVDIISSIELVLLSINMTFPSWTFHVISKCSIKTTISAVLSSSKAFIWQRATKRGLKILISPSYNQMITWVLFPVTLCPLKEIVSWLTVHFTLSNCQCQTLVRFTMICYLQSLLPHQLLNNYIPEYKILLFFGSTSLKNKSQGFA